jgi:hypothetical protein
LLFGVRTAVSAEGILLKFGDMPNRSVNVIDNTKTKLTLNISGDEKFIEENRQRGVTFPIVISNYRTQRISTRTGNTDENGSFPFEKEWKQDASFSEDEAGNRIRLDDSSDQLVGLVIEGMVDSDGRLNVTGFQGKSIGTERENIFRSMFENMKPESAPGKPLNVGDSYTTKSSIDMPIPGQEPIRLNVTSIYTLKTIEGSKAMFDIGTHFDLAGTPKGVEVAASGKGSGVMVYDIKNELRELDEIDMSAEIIFRRGELKVSSKMDSKWVMKQYLGQEK